jgi:hypothetical protein
MIFNVRLQNPQMAQTGWEQRLSGSAINGR